MQAINDAEADEKMADQLVALERSLSQEKAQTSGAESAGQDKQEVPKAQNQVRIGQNTMPAVARIVEIMQQSVQHGLPARLLHAMVLQHAQLCFGWSTSHHLAYIQFVSTVPLVQLVTDTYFS